MKKKFIQIFKTRDKKNPNFKLGHLIRTGDIGRVFSRDDSTKIQQ